MAISDVYDGLTQSGIEKMKQCKHPSCVSPSNYDEIEYRNLYRGENTGPHDYFDYHNL